MGVAHFTRRKNRRQSTYAARSTLPWYARKGIFAVCRPPSNIMPRLKSPRRSNRVVDVHGEIISGSGNVFADLKVPNPEIALAKAKLVQRIRDLLAERQLTQLAAGELLGLDQPKVSALLRGRVEGYTIDRLFRFLNALGQRVEISVRPVGQRRSAASRRSIVVTS